MLVPIEKIKMICFKKNVLAYDLLKLLKPRHFCSFPNQTSCMFPCLWESFQFCSVVFVVVLAVGYSGDKLFFFFFNSYVQGILTSATEGNLKCLWDFCLHGSNVICFLKRFCSLCGTVNKSDSLHVYL